MTRTRWPEWWSWELELTPHLCRRMEDRGFDEVALRTMFDRAKDIGPDAAEGRWAVYTTHRRKRWCLIVEPDAEDRLIVVITAYPVG